jgi:hypothetical protein
VVLATLLFLVLVCLFLVCCKLRRKQGLIVHPEKHASSEMDAAEEQLTDTTAEQGMQIYKHKYEKWKAKYDELLLQKAPGGVVDRVTWDELADR